MARPPHVTRALLEPLRPYEGRGFRGVSTPDRSQEHVWHKLRCERCSGPADRRRKCPGCQRKCCRKCFDVTKCEECRAEQEAWSPEQLRANADR